MKILLSILISLFFYISTYGQGETWNWYLGNSDGITFINGKSPKLIKLSPTYLWESNSSISDSIGNLILYSSANKILNKTGKVIIDTLKAHSSSSQGNLFLKHPRSSDIFFFSTSASGREQFGTRMTSFSQTKDSIIFDKVNVHVYPNTAEKMNAVNHNNNNDIWIVNHSINEDTFFLFLLKKQGLICCPIINQVGMVYDGNGLEGTGQVKFSQSGKRIINNTWFKSVTELFEFDNSTGKMYLKVSIPSSFSVCSEFAPDENIFYVDENASVIMQYNIDKNYNYKATVIKESKREFYNIRLGPDKNIYVVQIGNYLSAITKPNIIGLNCNYNDTFIKLSEPKNTPGLPNFNQSYFYTPSIDYAYEQDCHTNTIAFEGKDTIKSTTYKWIFSKGTKTDTKTTKDASYTFADTGKWQVKYIASTGSRSDTVTKTITIRPKLEQGFLGKDINYCETLPTLKAPKDLHCIHWYNDSMAELARVDSLTLTKEGTYYAKSTNLSFCVEWDTIKISKTMPKADFIVSNICENDSAVFVNKSAGANSYSWKFGDGLSSKFQNPKHKFQISTTTTFNVSLVAIADVCSDSINKAITVNQNPSSDFSYVLTGSNVDLKAVQTSNIKYEWKFGAMDSITQTISNYNRIINLSTQSKVCLRVTNLAGCVSQTCKDVTVGINPVIKDGDIKIYPNPSKGKLSIEISKAGIYNCKLYSIDGKLMMEKKLKGLQTETLNLKLAKASYLIRVCWLISC